MVTKATSELREAVKGVRYEPLLDKSSVLHCYCKYISFNFSPTSVTRVQNYSHGDEKPHHNKAEKVWVSEVTSAILGVFYIFITESLYHGHLLIIYPFFSSVNCTTQKRSQIKENRKCKRCMHRFFFPITYKLNYRPWGVNTGYHYCDLYLMATIAAKHIHAWISV